MPSIYDVVSGLNIDPMLAMMALEADTIEELDEVLSDIERQQDQQRAAAKFVNLRNKD